MSKRAPCVQCGAEKPPGRRSWSCGNCGPMVRIPRDVQDEIVRLYVEEHMTSAKIAERVFYAPGTVQKTLHLHGVKMRRGGAGTPRLPRDEVDRTIELYGQGLSVRQVADELGMSFAAVRRRLAVAGVPLRTRGDGTTVAHRRAIARAGAGALTAHQAEVLELVERGVCDTTTVIHKTSVPRWRAFRTLAQLEKLGLVRRGPRETTGKGRARTWRRNDLGLEDVLDWTLNPVNSRPRSGDSVPIGPLRDWLHERASRERRKAHMAGGGDTGTAAEVALARDLRITERRLYALLNEQDTVSVAVADQLLTNAGRDTTIFDLWPHLEPEPLEVAA